VVRDLRDLPILCIGGDRDRRLACARIATSNASSRTIASGHALGAHADQVFKLMQPMLRRLEAREWDFVSTSCTESRIQPVRRPTPDDVILRPATLQSQTEK
jgi:hypothetical protein